MLREKFWITNNNSFWFISLILWIKSSLLLIMISSSANANNQDLHWWFQYTSLDTNANSIFDLTPLTQEELELMTLTKKLDEDELEKINKRISDLSLQIGWLHIVRTELEQKLQRFKNTNDLVQKISSIIIALYESWIIDLKIENVSSWISENDILFLKEKLLHYWIFSHIELENWITIWVCFHEIYKLRTYVKSDYIGISEEYSTFMQNLLEKYIELESLRTRLVIQKYLP